MNNLFCIIMAGGVGSRFWPYSTNQCPKQFLDFFGTGRSLLQSTVERMEAVIPSENIYVVTNKSYREQIEQQCPQLAQDHILLEPMRRNTAPCIAYAVYKIKKRCEDAQIIVVPSDHLITNERVFLNIVREGMNFVSENDAILTLGIKPSRPETGYGYIQLGPGNTLTRKVKTFTEKPNKELAQVFVDSGEFFWNAGIFLFSIKTIVAAFQEHLPEIATKFEQLTPVFETPQESEKLNEVYATCQNISIDYGVMEKAQNVFVRMADFGWSDLGTWRSYYELAPKDKQQNAAIGGQTMLYESQKNIVVIPKDNIAVISGLEGYLVAQRGNTLLICPKDEESKLRQFVNDIAELPEGDKFL
ncbi:MAG: mannose-1-phosphate guanylyltransferase [Paludibacteraceae bacterium]|nr:mannose-1-phosphate guanylyltransferase [Paludibacteraceae bacterium]